jgi:hypothetical protein
MITPTTATTVKTILRGAGMRLSDARSAIAAPSVRREKPHFLEDSPVTNPDSRPESIQQNKQQGAQEIRRKTQNIEVSLFRSRDLLISLLSVSVGLALASPPAAWQQLVSSAIDCSAS